MGYTLDHQVLENTTDWQTLVFPLEDFNEHGAWHEQCYDPKGLFDWNRTGAIEIVTEDRDGKIPRYISVRLS